MFLSTLLALSLLAPTQAAASRAENREKAQAIYQQLENGKQPSFTQAPRYFTGSCVALAETIDPEGAYYAVLAIRDVAGAAQSTWLISYQGPSTDNPYAGLSQAQLEGRMNAYFPVTELRPERAYVHISDQPLLFAEFSASSEDASQINFAAMHLGAVYCQLKELKN